MTALSTQVGGDHYKNLKMQPIELCYKYQGTPCFLKVCKYLSRNKGSALEDTTKARHVILMEKELFSNGTGLGYLKIKYKSDRISMKEFVSDIKLMCENDLAGSAIFNMYFGNYSLATDAIDNLLEEIRHE